MRSRRSRRIRRRCALADRHRGDERQNRQHAVRRVTGSGQGTPPVQGRHGGVRGLNGPECTSSARRRSQEGGEATPLSRKEGSAKGEAIYSVCSFHCPDPEEHTSELQSLMRISYAVFCLKKKTINTDKNTPI